MTLFHDYNVSTSDQIRLYLLFRKASKLIVQIQNKHLSFLAPVTINHILDLESIKKFMQIPWYDLRRAPRSILSSMTVTGTTKTRVHSQFTLIPMKVLGYWLLILLFFFTLQFPSIVKWGDKMGRGLKHWKNSLRTLWLDPQL